jgi:hypothetical protein
VATGSSAAQEGASTGQLRGTVVDASGTPLPRVTLTAASLGLPAVTTTTNDEGVYRFPILQPGEYVLTAALQGHSPSQADLQIRSGGSLSINLVLSPARVGDPVVVTDTSGLGTGQVIQDLGALGETVFSKDLEKLPAPRDPWAILQTTPGVLTDRINIGGNESGQQSSVVSHGGTSDQHVWSVDGVNVTDMSALGSTPAYYGFDSLEEFRVITNGMEFGRSSGATVNIATRSGTNDFHGSAFVNMANSRPRSIALGLSGGTYLDRAQDYGGSVGGPLKRDRVWFFGTYGGQQLDLQGLSAGAPVSRDVDIHAYDGKLTSRFGDRHLLTGSYWRNDLVRRGDGSSSDRSPDATWERDGYTSAATAEYAVAFENSLALRGLVARTENRYDLIPLGGADAPAFLDPTNVFRDGFVVFNTDRPSTEYRADASSFFNTGALSHELRFGAGYRNFRDRTSARWAADTVIRDDGSGSLIALFPAGTEVWIVNEYTSAYLSDNLRIGNLTLTGGLRYDLQQGTNERSAATANPLRPAAVPGATFTGGPAPFEWGTILPRLGISYAFSDQARLSAWYGTYVDQLSTQLTGLTNLAPAPASFEGAEGFRFFDLNGNRRFDANEPRGASAITGIPWNDPRALQPRNIVDANLVPPATRQFGIYYGQQLRGWLLNTALLRRRGSDVIDSADLVSGPAGTVDVATPGSYVPGAVFTGTDLTGAPFTLSTSRLAPGLTFTGGDFVTNGGRERSYDGLQAELSRRFAKGFYLQANYTFSKSVVDVPPGFFQDANNLLGSDDDDGAIAAGRSIWSEKRGVFPASNWSYSVMASTRLVAGFDLSAQAFGRQGYPAPQFVTLNADGRRREVEVRPLGALRFDDVFVANFRVTKTFSFSDSGLTLSADIFNAFDSDTVLQRNGDLLSSQAGQILERLGPRTFRFGARLSF